MSHIVNIRTKITDPAALASACRRLRLGEPTSGTARLFSNEVQGLIVQLPDWTFSVVINPTTGDIQFDNFNGLWGKQTELDRLLQGYAVEKARIEARHADHDVTDPSGFRRGAGGVAERG